MRRRPPFFRISTPETGCDEFQIQSDGDRDLPDTGETHGEAQVCDEEIAEIVPVLNFVQRPAHVPAENVPVEKFVQRPEDVPAEFVSLGAVEEAEDDQDALLEARWHASFAVYPLHQGDEDVVPLPAAEGGSIFSGGAEPASASREPASVPAHETGEGFRLPAREPARDAREPARDAGGVLRQPARVPTRDVQEPAREAGAVFWEPASEPAREAREPARDAGDALPLPAREPAHVAGEGLDRRGRVGGHACLPAEHGECEEGMCAVCMSNLGFGAHRTRPSGLSAKVGWCDIHDRQRNWQDLRTLPNGSWTCADAATCRRPDLQERHLRQRRRR